MFDLCKIKVPSRSSYILQQQEYLRSISGKVIKEIPKLSLKMNPKANEENEALREPSNLSFTIVSREASIL